MILHFFIYANVICIIGNHKRNSKFQVRDTYINIDAYNDIKLIDEIHNFHDSPMHIQDVDEDPTVR